MAERSFQESRGPREVFYPPEFLQGCEYGKDLDCWQLGTAAFLMMRGARPAVGPPPASAGLCGEVGAK
eukprot:1892183-Pyramimonas_sp.AAC.1